MLLYLLGNRAFYSSPSVDCPAPLINIIVNTVFLFYLYPIQAGGTPPSSGVASIIRAYEH